MNKYTFLVYHKQYQSFLEELRNAGVVHVAQKEEGVEETEQLRNKLLLKAHVAKTIEAVKLLVPAGAELGAAQNIDGAELISNFESLNAKTTALQQEINAIQKEYNRMLAWGKYDLKKIDDLKANGYCLQFWTLSSSKLEPSWIEQYNLVTVNDINNQLYLVSVNKEPINIEAEAVTLSELDAQELAQKENELNNELENHLEQVNLWAAQNLKSLEQYAISIEENIDWQLVELNTTNAADDKIMLLEGYAPVENEQTLAALLEEQGVYYEVTSADKEDTRAPIKLKNNAFTKMYEVLTKMYGMPDYGEFDPTPILAPFFSLFFGMCMGDAGYGLALIALGFLLRAKMGKSMRGMMNLVITLGIFTTVAGAILGTFFGFTILDIKALEPIKDSLGNFIVHGSSNVAGITLENAMLVAVGIGIFHISVAMVVKSIGQILRYGFKESLGTLGWTLLIVGGVIIGSLCLIGLLPTNISMWAFIVIAGIAAIGIYFLNNIHRNPLINFGAGLYDTYNMATGILGDVLSYIRLYALGLAGGMLGGAFNMLANMAFEGACNIPVVGIVLGVLFYGLIFVFGHVLNIALSCLSAFVHPLRLSFVEYFKNAGYNGTGVEYQPFASKEKINN